MGSITPVPGLLLTHPRLRSPNQENAETFERWTRLHFKDLFDMPADASSGAKVDICIRGTAPEDESGYSHEEKPSRQPAYLYACLVGDINILKSQPYYSISRKLNLEQTRPLGELEKPVGYKGNDKEAMVFDIVDAKFAVYEAVNDAIRSPRSSDEIVCFPYPTLMIRINVLRPDMTPGKDPATIAEKLDAHLKIVCQWPKINAAVYRWAGKGAQPNEHPPIAREGNAEWMILALVHDVVGEWRSKAEAWYSSRERSCFSS